jgi:hypothetical protein
MLGVKVRPSLVLIGWEGTKKGGLVARIQAEELGEDVSNGCW